MKKKLLTFFTMGGWLLLIVIGIALLFLMGLTNSGLESMSIGMSIVSLILILLGSFSSWVGYIYCIVHVCKSGKLSDNGVVSLILILLFGIFYTPIYYTNHVLKDKKWWGILTSVVTSVLFIIIYVVLIALSVLIA